MLNNRARWTLAAIAAFGLIPAFLTQPAAAADTVYYLDVNGSTAGSGVTNNGYYTWNSQIWTTDPTGASATSTPSFSTLPGDLQFRFRCGDRHQQRKLHV